MSGYTLRFIEMTEDQIKGWVERAMDRLDARRNPSMTEGEYKANLNAIANSAERMRKDGGRVV